VLISSCVIVVSNLFFFHPAIPLPPPSRNYDNGSIAAPSKFVTNKTSLIKENKKNI